MFLTLQVLWHIYIYRYDVDMNVPRGDCGVFFFVSRKLIRDFTLILKTHWTAMFHNLKSPEDMYHVVPLYTFIIILIMLFHFRWLYIYTCRLLPNDFPYIYIQDTDVIWTFTITLMKNIFTELMVLYGNIHYIKILWKLC